MTKIYATFMYSINCMLNSFAVNINTAPTNVEKPRIAAEKSAG